MRYRGVLSAVLCLVAMGVLGASCSPDEGPGVPDAGTDLPEPELPAEGGNGNGPENNGNDSVMVNRNIKLTIGGVSFTASLEENEAARAFAALLPMTVDMTELNGNEKYCYLPGSLPTDAYRPQSVHAGDLMLFGSECLVLFYKTSSNGYSYTRLGRVDNAGELAAVVGSGNARVTFELIGNDRY